MIVGDIVTIIPSLEIQNRRLWMLCGCRGKITGIKGDCVILSIVGSNLDGQEIVLTKDSLSDL